MGGNALKNAHTERKNVEQYNIIVRKVYSTLKLIFPNVFVKEVVAYHQKDSFGDADILITTDNLPKDWISQVQKALDPTEMFVNRIGGKPLSFLRGADIPEMENIFAISFDVDAFQIDLICVTDDISAVAEVYYSYNDLGNFMGRIADRMGLKYGWDGLKYTIRKNGDQTITMGTFTLTKDPRIIFEFLGYDYDRYLEGFETMNDVYEYAASSPYFSRNIFALENRNNKDRVRDEKRASYRGFLEWQDQQDINVDKYHWCDYPLDAWGEERWNELAEWKARIGSHFGGFDFKVNNETRAYENAEKAKLVWNGNIVSNVSGYKGKELGDFMKFCEKNYVNEIGSRGFTFHSWVMVKSSEQVELFIQLTRPIFEKQKGK